MTKPWKSRKFRRVTLAVLIPAFPVLWFVTAPAGMAIQRITSGGNGGPLSRLICAFTDWYESPMVYTDKAPAFKRMSDSLADSWCQVLGAPETTP
jgi:hypothetical protein